MAENLRIARSYAEMNRVPMWLVVYGFVTFSLAIAVIVSGVVVLAVTT